MPSMSINFKVPEEDRALYEATSGKYAFCVLRHLKTYLEEKSVSSDFASERFSYDDAARFLDKTIASYDLKIR